MESDLYSNTFNNNQALLDDDSIVDFDGSGDNIESSYYTEENGWRYLGEGVLYSINETPQNDGVRRYFWKKIKVD